MITETYQLAIKDSQRSFEELCDGHLNYGTEEIFALQMLAKTEFSLQVANQNPRSVQLAMINVASTGLSLNPAMGYAYLIPRDGAIVLDISYKGLIKIATDIGAIEWVRAECVHENDKFTYHGPAKMPEIICDPFRPRGSIIGSYCIAKTKSGDILTEVMDLTAIEAIRNTSTSWVKSKKGPWAGAFFPEMCRKVVIKRARKTWPYSDRDDRMAKAIEIANQSEGGYVFDQPETESRLEYIDEKQEITIKDMLDATKADQPTFLRLMGADSVVNIRAKDYQKAIDLLRANERRRKERGME